MACPLSVLERAKSAFMCQICSDDAHKDLRAMRCCGQLLCFVCADAIFAHGLGGASLRCPYCNDEATFEKQQCLLKLPFLPELLPVIDHLSAECMRRRKAMFVFRGDLLRLLFPRLSVFMMPRRMKMVGEELYFWLRMAQALRHSKIEGQPNADRVYLGGELYRVIAYESWTLEKIQRFAVFLRKFKGEPLFIANCAFPETYRAPRLMFSAEMDKGTMVGRAMDYVLAWVDPFRENAQVLKLLFKAFGLPELAYRAGLLLPHGEKWGRCFCLLCAVRGKLRNALRHIQLMECNVPYYLNCLECAATPLWQNIRTHYASTHANVQYRACGCCDGPLSGTRVNKTDHETECPKRFSPFFHDGSRVAAPKPDAPFQWPDFILDTFPREYEMRRRLENNSESIEFHQLQETRWRR